MEYPLASVIILNWNGGVYVNDVVANAFWLKQLVVVAEANSSVGMCVFMIDTLNILADG